MGGNNQPPQGGSGQKPPPPGGNGPPPPGGNGAPPSTVKSNSVQSLSVNHFAAIYCSLSLLLNQRLIKATEQRFHFVDDQKSW
jgi:hypothetical protein